MHDCSLQCTFLEDASLFVMDKRYASDDLYESRVLNRYEWLLMAWTGGYGIWRWGM